MPAAKIGRPPDKDKQKLRILLRQIYDRLDAMVEVSPSWLATEALLTLDPHKRTPTMVYLAAHLELRQIGREFCRIHFEPDDDSEAEQHPLFPGIQKRYPRKHELGKEPVYVRAEHMNEADVAFNVTRLKREGEAKIAHATRLEAWWQERLRAA
jgi:hypothetical protein